MPLVPFGEIAGTAGGAAGPRRPADPFAAMMGEPAAGPGEPPPPPAPGLPAELEDCWARCAEWLEARGCRAKKQMGRLREMAAGNAAGPFRWSMLKAAIASGMAPEGVLEESARTMQRWPFAERLAARASTRPQDPLAAEVLSLTGAVCLCGASGRLLTVGHCDGFLVEATVEMARARLRASGPGRPHVCGVWVPERAVRSLSAAGIFGA